MRKVLFWSMAALVITMALPAVMAEDNQAADSDKKFEVTGDFRVRYDRLDNYFDADSDSRDLFSFFPYRALLGVSGNLANDIQVVLQVQGFGSFGNQSPAQSTAYPPFQDFDGDGSVGGFRRSEVSVYQAYANFRNLGNSNVDLRVGRQEFALGTGLILGNESFYNGTVFDGLRASWAPKDSAFDLQAVYFKITERQDPANSFYYAPTDRIGAASTFVSADADLYGLIGGYNIEGGMKSRIEGYVLRYTDHYPATYKPDFWTYGAHWWRTVRTIDDARELPFDWNAELAMQSGTAHDSATDEDLKLKNGFIANPGFGYNLATSSLMHRFYGTYIYQSGDSDLTDNDIEGWIPIYPEIHGLYGNADWFGSSYAQNEASIQAYSLGYTLTTASGKHAVGARYWWFEPVETNLKFSDGEGGTVSYKVKSYGTEFDLGYDFRYSKNATFSGGIAMFKPGDGITGENNPQDNITRFWVQTSIRF
jgi:hypothetical protein